MPSNKFEFNTTRDFREENFKERPSDVVVEGKSIFEDEKTPAQKEVIKTAFKLLYQHMKEIGVEPTHPFDEKRVIFAPVRKIEEGMYHEGDFVFLSRDTEANLETIIHELTHAYSSEWRNYEEEKLEPHLKSQDRRVKVKSGFHVVYKGIDREGSDPYDIMKINFWALNEGITERIAREIVSKNVDELKRLKPLFEGVLEKKLAEKEKEFNEITLPEVKAKIAEKRIKYEEGIKELENELKALEEKLNLEIENETNPEEKKFLEFSKESELSSFGLDLKFTKRAVESLEKEIGQAVRIYEMEVSDLKNNYSFSNLEQGGYDFEVSVVDKIVEGLGKFYLKDKSSSNILAEKERAWVDLQKAYFAGRTVFLRVLEKSFGSGFLRNIEQVSPLMSETEKAQFIQNIEKSIDNI